MAVNIRQADKKDQLRLWDFVQTAYGKRSQHKVPDRWLWEFTNNPFLDEEKLPIFIAEDGDKIVGQTCGMYVPLKIKNKKYKAAWGVDFIILPEYRGLGLGPRLQQAMGACPDIFFSIVMAHSARYIKKKIGHKPAPAVTVYRKFVKSSPDIILLYLSKRLRKYPLLQEITRIACTYFQMHLFLSYFINLSILVYNKINRCGFPDFKHLISEIELFDDRINVLWNRTCNQYDIIVSREKQYLNWKFVQQPNLPYKKFIALINNDIKGYVVLRKGGLDELYKGHIIDLYCQRNDHNTILSLLSFAINWFGNNVSSIECATTVHEYRQALQKLGFIMMEHIEPLYFTNQPHIAEMLSDKHAEWFLAKGDDDWDQHPPI